MTSKPAGSGITLRAALEFAAVTLIWGSTWLVIKGQLGVVPATWSVTYRFAISGAVMVLYCLARRTWVAPTRAAHGFALAAAPRSSCSTTTSSTRPRFGSPRGWWRWFSPC